MSGFTFKQFHIDHDRCGMKVGTDGILLGAWTRVGAGVGQTLDIGTGSGLIALMLAQRSDPVGRITGVEIDAGAALQARENVNRSPWAHRVTVITESVQWVAREWGSAFDLIVSNPPFYHP
ncbi:MAG: tRNA1(Val) (adenine(37)-N6)-methyltransferase, partial [Planctomycetota bacterium]